MAKLFDPMQDTWDTKLLAGEYMIKSRVKKEGDRLFLEFPYNQDLLNEVKNFEGSKWHGKDEYKPRKEWSVRDSVRNRFQLRYLENPGNTPDNPYWIYDQPIKSQKYSRPLYLHQREMSDHGLAVHYGIWAAEMGTGKSLSAIEVMERSGMHDWVWVGPKSALISARLEFKKWNSIIKPVFETYEGLQKLLANWPSGKKAPMGFIVDECSRCKNPTAKRTVAVRYLADRIRAEWGPKGFVILMSGTPAPKSPADWWSLAEIACPGFLKEGTLEKFKNRLAIIEQVEKVMGGGTYPQLVTWKDDANKCNKCGLPKESETHSGGVDVFQQNTMLCHPFQPSINEVELLGKRLKGLTIVKYKKDCLDLPEKIYREIELQPTLKVQNLAEIIKAKARTAAEALTLQRELSDGFQYTETIVGKQTCDLCHGNRTILAPVYADDTTEEEIQAGTAKFTMQEQGCDRCSGIGEIDKTVRTAHEIPTPKEDCLIELLDEFDDVGRLVVCAGFTGSIDRIMAIVKKAQWNIVKIDGRGWLTDLPHVKDDEAMIEAFQDPQKRIPRMVVIMHPKSGGMGLTLTASPAVVYWSNDFDFESRAQSEDRIHRPGIDMNRGATIIDMFHLPSDRKTFDNLKAKKRLQDLTMADI